VQATPVVEDETTRVVAVPGTATTQTAAWEGYSGTAKTRTNHNKLLSFIRPNYKYYYGRLGE
jgi:hypothetical protein